MTEWILPQLYDIFNDLQEQKRNRVAAAFPRWCQNAQQISASLDDAECGSLDEVAHMMDKRILANVRGMGIERLFPVQRALCPELLRDSGGIFPRDFAVQAPTGSGKTLAFALPITSRLASRAVPHIRALVVLPTRELAQQVAKVIDELIEGTSLNCHLLVGAQHLAHVCHQHCEQ